VAAALAAFDPVWEALTPKEQARIVKLLVSHVDYDGQTGNVAITFHATGLASLTDQLAAWEEAA
jgi:site-specific DNA recombinase